MGYDISYADYCLGCGVVYHGKVKGAVATKKEIALNMAKYIEIKVATTTGEEKKKWIEKFKIKDKDLQDIECELRNQLADLKHKKKNAYLDLKKLGNKKSRDEKQIYARISTLNGQIKKIRTDLIYLKAEDLILHDKSIDEYLEKQKSNNLNNSKLKQSSEYNTSSCKFCNYTGTFHVKVIGNNPRKVMIHCPKCKNLKSERLITG